MVELTEATADDLLLVERDEDYEDIEEEEVVFEESLLERLEALKDIIPPVQRAYLSRSLNYFTQFGIASARLVGSGLWMVTTASLIVLLPVSLELERDSMAIQQDQQMRQSAQE